MTPEQRAALRWAIETARMKADAARRQSHRSPTRQTEQMQREHAEQMSAFARDLQALLTDGDDAR